MRFKTWFFQEDSVDAATTSGTPSQVNKQVVQTANQVANTASTLPGMKNIIGTKDPKTQQTMAIDLAAQAEKRMNGQQNATSSPVLAANSLLKQIKAPMIGQKPGNPLTNTPLNVNNLGGGGV